LGSSSRGTTLSKGGDQWESFKGKGETLNGRKTKGKGVSHRKVEDVGPESKIIRTDKNRVVTNNSLESETQAPAPLNLPFGKLFFGFKVVPYTPPTADGSKSPGNPEPTAFIGSGHTLSGREGLASQGKGKERSVSMASPLSWGHGQTLNSRSQPNRSSEKVGAGGASVPIVPQRNGSGVQPPSTRKTRSPSPDWGVDDDDVIVIDSD